MKRLLIISLLALGGCSSNKTEQKATDDANSNKISASIVNNPHTADGVDAAAASVKPIMTFTDTLHDFGKMHEGETVQYEFSFTNTGKGPLIISSAQGSCGCTIPDYPHDPITPGQSAVIKVSFNSAGKNGPQDKSITIHTNTMRSTEMLFIKAEVAKK